MNSRLTPGVWVTEGIWVNYWAMEGHEKEIDYFLHFLTNVTTNFTKGTLG
jgi:hypothetical protein